MVERIKLKHMDEAQLIEAIRSEGAGIITEHWERARELATAAHAGQVRKDPVQGRENTPYIEHCHRGVLRLIRFKCTFEDVLIASELHDAVEDGAMNVFPDAADEPAARELLRALIGEEFGERVLRIVDGVTNAYELPGMRRALSDAQKFAAYAEKVTREISTSLGVFLVKLVDYIDNAGSLHHTPDADIAKAQRLARKYLPLINPFRHTAALCEQQFGDVVNWGEIEDVLERIEERLLVLAG
jgi:(p)ppGpp synthase/HD superfamily hydrolase